MCEIPLRHFQEGCPQLLLESRRALHPRKRLYLAAYSLRFAASFSKTGTLPPGSAGSPGSSPSARLWPWSRGLPRDDRGARGERCRWTCSATSQCRREWREAFPFLGLRRSQPCAASKSQEAVEHPASGTVNVNGTLQNPQAGGRKNLNFLDKFRR